jgi:hypothetical protein
MWFGGRVTGLTLVSFALMVGSSVIAGWSDVATSIAKMSTEAQAVLDSVSGLEVPLEGVKGGVGAFNPGYFWMATNCLASAAYVSVSSSMHWAMHEVVKGEREGQAAETQGGGGNLSSGSPKFPILPSSSFLYMLMDRFSSCASVSSSQASTIGLVWCTTTC